MMIAACLVAALDLLMLAVGKLDDLFREEPVMVLFMVGYVVVFGVYFAVTRIIRKNKAVAVESDSAAEEDLDLFSLENDPRVRAVKEKIYASLGADESAKTVDVLFFDYKTVDGKVVPQKKGKRIDFMNIEMKLFVEGESLCLADTDIRYDFPLAALRSIRTERESGTLTSWNKSTPHDRGEYRIYGVSKDQSENFVINSYHVLEFCADGEIYGIYFPNYDLPAVCEIVELTLD